MSNPRGPTYLILAGLWMYSLIALSLPAAIAVQVVHQKTLFLGIFTAAAVVNVLTGLYFVFGFGERHE